MRDCVGGWVEREEMDDRKERMFSMARKTRKNTNSMANKEIKRICQIHVVIEGAKVFGDKVWAFDKVAPRFINACKSP